MTRCRRLMVDPARPGTMNPSPLPPREAAGSAMRPRPGRPSLRATGNRYRGAPGGPGRAAARPPLSGRTPRRGRGQNRRLEERPRLLLRVAAAAGRVGRCWRGPRGVFSCVGSDCHGPRLSAPPPSCTCARARASAPGRGFRRSGRLSRCDERKLKKNAEGSFFSQKWGMGGKRGAGGG